MDGHQTRRTRRQFHLRPLLAAAAILVAIGIYLPALNYGFIIDDYSQIARNYRVHSWHFLPQFFTAPVWQDTGFHNSVIPAPYYRPAFLVWLAANYTILGGNIAAWHLSTILLFAVSTWLVYLLARELTGHWTIASIAALVFAVHPIHIESVAWVSGVTDPLLAVSFLGALLCHIRWRLSGRRALRAAAIVLCGTALLSKEPAVVLCGVFILYDYLFAPGTFAERWRRASAGAWPYLVLTALYLIVRNAVLSNRPPSLLPLHVMVLTWPSVVWAYVRHLVVPWALSFIYNDTYVEHFGPTVFVPAILLLAVALALCWWARRSRLILFGCAWIALTLLPVLNLGALVPGEVVHDRYLYLPSVAFSILIAAAIYRLARAARNLGRLRVMFTASTAAVAVFALLTLVQSRLWSDEKTLLTHAHEMAPGNPHATQELAYSLARTGQCEDAFPLLAEVAEKITELPQTPFFQGSCYLQSGRLDVAESFMLQALSLQPGYQPALLDLAWIYLNTGRIDDAENAWRRAAESTGHPEVALHAVRADILRARGDLAGAADQLRQALLIQPDNAGFQAQLNELEAKRAPR